jgi:exopolysaccharide biosynthesis polyprenyl glycosylphosphotransferase
MLKENWRFVARIQRVSDLIITILAFLTAYEARSALYYWDKKFKWGLPFEGPDLLPFKEYITVLLIAVAAYVLILNWLGAYSSMRLTTSWQLFRLFLLSSFFAFFTIAAVLFLLKIDISRSFLGLFALIMVLFLSAERYFVLALLRYFRKKGFNFRNVIICGVGRQAERLAKEIYSKPELGVLVRCFADLSHAPDFDRHKQFKQSLRASSSNAIARILTGFESASEALKDYAIDEVIFTDITQVLPEVENLVLVCAEQGVRTTVAADLFSTGLIKSELSYFADIPLIHFQTPPGDRWELSLKRFIDVFLATILLISLLPLMFVIALVIKFTSQGNIFYIQKRVGLNGRLFDMYKFRSMFENAEQQLIELKAKNEMQGPAFKLSDDPRITPIGKWLRRFSLDELPQLWNVIIGDMSLVGPRPPVPNEVSEYVRNYRRRLSMRPGLTCTWQVSGRNEIKDFESWVKLDLEYIDNWSLTHDFKLLFRTIPAVIFGRGAK